MAPVWAEQPLPVAWAVAKDRPLATGGCEEGLCGLLLQPSMEETGHLRVLRGLEHIYNIICKRMEINRDIKKYVYIVKDVDK